MAQPPPAKKLKKMPNTTAHKRVEQFPGEGLRAASNDILFCDYCHHTLTWERHDTVKDHVLKSKKHQEAKEKAASDKRLGRRQSTIPGTRTSREMRQEFVDDFLITILSGGLSIECADTFKPFLLKWCSQAGALPTPSVLRKTHLDRVFECHVASLKEKVAGKAVNIVFDETCDSLDRSVLNIIAVVDRVAYLLDVVFMDKVNHSTVGDCIVRCINKYDIKSRDVLTFVSDNAAYCKKAFRVILQELYPRATHICCLAHILNLVGEVFHNSFKDLSYFCSLFKSAFYKKGARKRRYLQHLRDNGLSPALAPVPTATRWNSFLKTARYHSDHIEQYLAFFEDEAQRSGAQVSSTVENIVKLLQDSGDQLCIEALFVATECQKIGNVLDYLQGSTKPLSLAAWSRIEEIDTYLHQGTAKMVFRDELDAALRAVPSATRIKYIDQFHRTFDLALLKFLKHTDELPAKGIYKRARVFDPNQAIALSSDLDDYEQLYFRLPGSDDVDEAYTLQEEWDRYHTYINSQVGQAAVAESRDVPSFWQSQEKRFPILSETAATYMSVPVSSCDAERSFSNYKHILNDRRESNTEAHVTMLVMMNFNGDVTKQLMNPTLPEMR